MVSQTIHYVGNLRCEAVHDPSATQLITDAPKDNMGQGESFSPTDLMGTALATCILTTMAIAARKWGVELGISHATINKEMTIGLPRRLAKLSCQITVSGIADVEIRQKIEEIGYNCPVHLSLHSEVLQIITIDWK